jgi:hypothetical protein
MLGERFGVRRLVGTTEVGAADELPKVRFTQKGLQLGDSALQSRNFVQQRFWVSDTRFDREGGKDRFELKQALIRLRSAGERKLRRKEHALVITKHGIRRLKHRHRFFRDHVGEQKQLLTTWCQMHPHSGGRSLTRRLNEAFVQRLEAEEDVFFPFKHIKASVR